MRITLLSAVLLSLGIVCFALPAAAEDAAGPAPAAAPASPASNAAPAEPRATTESTGAGASVSPKITHGLTRVHGDLTSDASASAGSYRSLDPSARAASTTRAVRLPASPRVLRRMNADRAMSAVDTSIRACASESTTVAPISFGLRVLVGPAGDVETAELAPPANVPARMLACVIKAVSAVRFGAPGAGGAAVAVPIQVPGRIAARVAPAAVPAAVAATPASAPAAAPAVAPAVAPAPAPAPAAATAEAVAAK